MKTFFVVALMSLLSFLQLRGQIIYDGVGFGMVSYKLNGATNTSNDPDRPFYELSEEIRAKGFFFTGTFNFQLPVYKFNSDLAIGMSLNAGLGIQGSKLEGISPSFVFDFPEYLTLNIGNGATKDSKEEIGYAFGLGYNYTYTALPLYSPSVMAQLTYNKLLFRLHFNVLKTTYYYYYTSEGDVPAAKLGLLGILIAFRFK